MRVLIIENVVKGANTRTEVERARRLIQDALRGYKIKSVQTTEDKIVYAGGITHDEFVCAP